MRRGEAIISVALALAVAISLALLAHHWRMSSLNLTAVSDGEAVPGGVPGAIPNLAGYDRVETFWLPRGYRAAIYRSTAASLGLASGKFIVYDRAGKPSVKLRTLEGVKDPWTQVYDFAGRNGVPDFATGGRPAYTRDLTGDGNPDLIVGEFSGGDQCCTEATVIELGKTSATRIGKIQNLEGWPFQGLEVRRLKQPDWQLIAHRYYGTSCGSGADSADILTIYRFHNGQFSDGTPAFAAYLEAKVKRSVSGWAQSKSRTIGMLQTITAEYLTLGQAGNAHNFFDANLAPFLPQWKSSGSDPESCFEDIASLNSPSSDSTQ